MKRKPTVVLAGVLLTALGAAAFGAFFLRAQEASAVGDPRQEPPVVRLVTAVQVDRIRTRLHGHHRGEGAEQSRFSCRRQDR